MNWLREKLRHWLGIEAISNDIGAGVLPQANQFGDSSLLGGYWQNRAAGINNGLAIDGLRRDLDATNDLLLRVEQRQAADDVKHLEAYDRLEAEINSRFGVQPLTPQPLPNTDAPQSD